MRQCERCRKWFPGGDSTVCDPCWEDMGQMSFFQDEGMPFEDEGADHRIDTIFDRDREMYGRDW